jgi:hypothetical protein
MPRRRLPSLLAVTLVLATLPACAHEGPEPSPYVPLVQRQAPPAVVLSETPMTGTKSWEPLLSSFSLLGGDEELLQWLPDAASHQDAQVLARDPSARQLSVQAIYRMIQAPNFTERFETIRALVDALQAAAPDSPETLFARAFLRWVLLTDGQGHLTLHGLERAIASDLQRDFRTLVEKFPQFDGPGEFDRVRLKRELAATEVLLAESATPTVSMPTAPSPTAP